MAHSDDAGITPPTNDDGSPPQLRAHESAPGTIVLVESDNNDGWIATDDAIDLKEYR